MKNPDGLQTAWIYAANFSQRLKQTCKTVWSTLQKFLKKE